MQDLKPTVWIGKQGCTQAMIEEIAAQLRKRRMIKVKWLQNTEVDPEEIALRARVILVEVRGRTMVLAAKGKAAGNPVSSAKVSESAKARVLGNLKPAKKK
jgi:RNA-binding protein